MKFFHTLKRWQRIALVVALVALVLAAVFLLTGRETPAQEPQNLAVSLTPSAATDAPTEPAAQTPSQASTEAAAEPPATTGTEPLTEAPAQSATQGTDAPTEPTQPPTQAEAEPPTDPPTEPEEPSCTISISCATVLNHMDRLSEPKKAVVPAGGVMLGTTKVTLDSGDTVFDVLQWVTAQYGIQMEFSIAPLYNTAYIEGIGNLYEKDCGPQSGWMYTVNGVFPSYGVSDYVLKDGDVICFLYTCDLGADLGA